MSVGGAKLDSPTETGEIYTSTLGLLIPGKTSLQIVVSGHAVGDAGSPIVLADGITIGAVTHNSYLRGPVGGSKPHGGDGGGSSAERQTAQEHGQQTAGFQPAGPDVAVGKWNYSVLGLPLTVALATTAASFPLPITGSSPATPALPIQIFGASGGLRMGVVAKADATVTDAATLTKVHNVAVAAYDSDRSTSGAPIVTVDPETAQFLLVGFHGGLVQPANADESPTAPTLSWFVPWQQAQKALALMPLPPV